MQGTVWMKDPAFYQVLKHHARKSAKAKIQSNTLIKQSNQAH